MVPVITIATSVLLLHEQLTLLAGARTVLTLAGLFLSEHKAERKMAHPGFIEFPVPVLKGNVESTELKPLPRLAQQGLSI